MGSSHAHNISPQFSRNLDRFTEFLTLVGITSLIVGGVGVANAMHGFVERKRQTIAILKALGATGSTVFALMLTQALLVASAGAALGAAFGAALPFVAASAFGTDSVSDRGGDLSGGDRQGAFLWLCDRASVFRRPARPARTTCRFRPCFAAESNPGGRNEAARSRLDACRGSLPCFDGCRFCRGPTARLDYLGATLAAFVLLRVAALLIMAGAKRLPHPRGVASRLAVGNIHRPGALTSSVVLSLGLGVALLVVLTLIDGNISAESTIPSPGRR